jgi:hypothetical protein
LSDSKEKKQASNLSLLVVFKEKNKIVFKFSINTKSDDAHDSNRKFEDNLVFLIFYFRGPCKIPERWIHHTTILILGPQFLFWALKVSFAFLTPKNIVFLAPY